ncbi:MAG: type II secretion system protein [Proteobacteria bacterium]|nr:type II secretion system protein [Pseudomonadota bacterium]
MRLRRSQGFTLIELLVVVAIIGILSAVGVVSYTGYKSSAEKKQAEITLNLINLAQQEYKSNNGEYCISTCSNNAGIIQNLFDGVDDLSAQTFNYSNNSNNTLTMMAVKKSNSACTITITQTNKNPIRSGC